MLLALVMVLSCFAACAAEPKTDSEYVKKNGKLYKKDMSSLPIGILNEVKFAKEAITLSSGDLIVMVSDGAITGDDKWLEHMINNAKDKSCEDLSYAIVEEAKKHRNDGHDDDITAIAINIIDLGANQNVA